MIRKAAIVCLVLLSAMSVHAQNFEKRSVYYSDAEFKLNDAQKKSLDSLVVFYSNRRISINGYADYAGTEDRNNLVAERRATLVLRYLVDRGFPETQIMNASGMGQKEIKATTTGKATAANRRVDIFITKGLMVKGTLKELPAPPPPPQVVVPKAVAEETALPTNVTKIDYEKLKAGDVIALSNIGFIPSTDRLMPDAYPEVEHLYEVLKNHPTLKIVLEGHVCCVPAPDGFSPGTISWDLSVDRARRVQSLLIERGIAEARLSYRGYGRTKPIFPDEKTGAQQQANRRVDIRIVSK